MRSYASSRKYAVPDGTQVPHSLSSVCYIRQGLYRETVKPLWTGVAGAPLTFQAWNNENVVISGADPVTGWSAHSGSIYKAPMNWTIGRYNNQVIVDGKMAWAARTPNVDEDYNPSPYLTYCGAGVYKFKSWQSELEPVAIPSLGVHRCGRQPGAADIFTNG
jgi:hypothetical protein